MSPDDWANMFTFNGNTYPIGQWGTVQRGSKSESISNNFEQYVESAFKRSGIVFAAMIARHCIFAEARLVYQEIISGNPGDLLNKPTDLNVLDKPWPNGTTSELLMRAIQDADMAGNNYVVTEGVPGRLGYRLRRMRPDWVEILLSAPPDEALQSDVVAYIYKPGGDPDPDKWEIFPIDGSKGIVAHWSPIPDPTAQYRGMSPLTPVVREIMADKAATDHKARFFENAATPNLAVSFKETVTDQQFAKFMQAMNESKHGVEHAYETLYLGGGADVTVIGSHIAQMDFKGTQGYGAEIICGALGIHPLIVGTSGGFSREPLSQESLTAAKDLLADRTLRPLWRSLCSAYAVLVPEYDNARLWFDDSDIAFLRQDQEQVAKIQNLESSTLSSYVLAGFTPESSKLAIKHNNIDLLEHTGLYSVQLQPPLTALQAPGDANTPDTQQDTKPANKKPSSPSQAQPQAPNSTPPPPKKAPPVKGDD